jgi:hypothetical protein
MQGILIDPFTKTVSEVSYNGNYKEIYKLTGCSTFTVIELDANGETLFIDDNGLLENPEHFFKWEGYEQPLAGKGLILGTDSEGESVGTKFTKEFVEAQVTWPEIALAGWTPTESGVIDHPILGKDTGIVYGARPIFEAKEDKS